MAIAASLPAWTGAVGFALSALGVVLTAIGVFLALRWRPRKGNEGPRRGRPLRVLRFWRPSQYSLALGNLLHFIERLTDKEYSESTFRGRVTKFDLVRWVVQEALSCAAAIVPQSLGKANLFRVSQIVVSEDERRSLIRVYSSEFVGVFSPQQLIDGTTNTHIRDLKYSPADDKAPVPVALQCLAEGLPLMQPLGRPTHAFDLPEVNLGATHVLGIPISKSLATLTDMDQPVSITVDLRFSRVGGWLLDQRDFQKTSLYRRARQLEDALQSVPELSDPVFSHLLPIDAAQQAEEAAPTVESGPRVIEPGQGVISHGQRG